jgi:hypothetical protein
VSSSATKRKSALTSAGCGGDAAAHRLSELLPPMATLAPLKLAEPLNVTTAVSFEGGVT